MKIHCYKYQAAGNDFVLVDNRKGELSFTNEQISKICDRRFGIGGDGIILLEKATEHAFKMVYHNADGSISFCGNGCRAIVHLANKLGVVGTSTSFIAHDGAHHAEILPDGTIKVSIQDVKVIEKKSDEDFFVHTGTEHNVRFVKNLDHYPVAEEGRKIRYGDMYKPNGTNADFVELGADGSVSFRIYERGVEAETFSSGSGATACALVAARQRGLSSPIHVKARGGNLVIEFQRDTIGNFKEISYTGPVELVFETEIEIG